MYNLLYQLSYLPVFMELQRFEKKGGLAIDEPPQDSVK
jgi:hypothetical protein